MSDEAGGGAAGSFRFVVLNDLHYMDDIDRPWLEGIVRQINDARNTARGSADLCLVLGDLAENGSEEELSAARKILGGLDMPYFTVPGNHDGPPGRGMGGPAGLEIYDRLFPGRRNYTFENRGWQFLALDSTDGSGWQHVRLRPETVAYAKEAASRLDPQRPTILFTHFPVAPGIPYGLDDGVELMAMLRRLNLRMVFSGHYHGMTTAVYNGVELVTNRCCSMRREIHDGGTSRGYFWCRALADGKVEREFVEYRG